MTRDDVINLILKESKTPGEFLKRVMGYLNISVVELAKRMDVSQSYISMLLNDINIPREVACLKLATHLEIDPKTYYMFCSNYAIDKYLEEQNFKAFVNEIAKSDEANDVIKCLYKIAKKLWNKKN